MNIVQLSDTHIRLPGRLAYNRVDTAGAMEAAVKSIQQLRQPASCVVITGDLVDFGQREEYQHLRELLSPLYLPVYLLPGNHDDRDALREVFSDHHYLPDGAFVQYSIDLGRVQLVAIDTVVPMQSHGELCGARLQWLADTLDECTGKPVVLMMHHPPFDTLIGHMDKVGLLGGRSELRDIVARHPNIERILCGHLHRAIDVRFAGTIASTCPAPAHQVSLDLSPDAPSQFEMEPPGYRIHAWHPTQCLVTHTAHIGNWDGPYPFYDEGGLIGK
jgi:3',5'-cyclic-AMP phosphodiesterase